MNTTIRQQAIRKVLWPYFSYVGLLILFYLFNLQIVYAQDIAATVSTPITSYNRVTDETSVGISMVLGSHRVSTPSAEMPGSLTLAAGFRFKGQQLLTQPTTVRLALQRRGEARHFAEGLNLIGNIDGVRIDFGILSYTQNSLGANRVETLRVEVPVRLFLHLVQARAVKLRVGVNEMTLDPIERSNLATLAERLTKTAILPEPSIGTSSIAAILQVSQSARTTLPAAELESRSAATESMHSCPVQIQQLRPFRGFRLGQPLSEVMQRFRSGPPPVPPADMLGIRTLHLPLTGMPSEHGVTRLSAIRLRFLDERLYQIEATYLIGKEWTAQPMSAFANSINRELGVASPWKIGTNNNFDLSCGAAQLAISVDEDSFIGMPAGRRESIAMAYFTLTDVAATTQLKQKRIDAQQRSRQRDVQQRRIFKP